MTRLGKSLSHSLLLKTKRRSFIGKVYGRCSIRLVVIIAS